MVTYIINSPPPHPHTQTTWERTTDKKIERNTVQRRMEGLLRQQQYSLEERREKWVWPCCHTLWKH